MRAIRMIRSTDVPLACNMVRTFYPLLTLYDFNFFYFRKSQFARCVEKSLSNEKLW